MDNVNGTYVDNSILPRLERLKKVQHVNPEVLTPFAENTVRCIKCTSKEKSVRLYLVLGSYSTEIPEQEDMLGVKYSTCTGKCCPRCHALEEDLKYSIAVKPWISKEPIQVIREQETFPGTVDTLCNTIPAVLHVSRKQAKQKPEGMSIQPVNPFY